MLDFSRSFFTWKSRPWFPDEFYKYPGGFVGTPGEVYQVRFNLEGACTLVHEASDTASETSVEMFVGAPCRTEYTIARRNLFQVPSSEFRFAFSRTRRLAIATRPSHEQEPVTTALLDDAFQDHKLTLRRFETSQPLTTVEEIVEATLEDRLINARTTYRDRAHSCTVTVEYPVNLINVNAETSEFQVCTGPLILPDLTTWDGETVHRVFLAHAAFTAFDHVEFILQREVEAAAHEQAWLDQPRGRDRLELLDPNHAPPNYPPPRPRPTIYNETWALDAENTLVAAQV